jgi:hypothetical protein
MYLVYQVLLYLLEGADMNHLLLLVTYYLLSFNMRPLSCLWLKLAGNIQPYFFVSMLRSTTALNVVLNVFVFFPTTHKHTTCDIVMASYSKCMVCT